MSKELILNHKFNNAFVCSILILMTGKPGQMITELDGRKMSNLKSEAGLASPDTFRPMTNPPNTNKQHYAKQRTFPR